MQAFVDHGCISIRSLLAAPETKGETVNEITLRRTLTLLKRQGTPKRSRMEMSHHVVEGDSHQAESKGLAGETERLIGHRGTVFSPVPMPPSRNSEASQLGQARRF
jgi:hypothetical protein